jgi:glycerol uptake facilitator-like aquaporin
LRQYFYRNAVIKNESLRIFFGETLAVMIYITVGLSSVATYRLSVYKNPYLSDPLALYFGYSIGAMFAVLICGKVSGIDI